MTSTAPPQPATGRRFGASRSVAMIGLAAAMFLVILDSTMVNLAGTTIREDLGLTATELTVVVDAYLVPFAGLLLLGGRLADVLGGRRVFLTGLAVYLAASAVCALAETAGVLIAGRIAQGIGAAVVIPAALSLVLGLYRSPAERTRALGVWGAVGGLGSLLGVFLGGAMTQSLGWETVFWTPVPIGALAAVVVWFTAPVIPGRPGNFDLLGAITISLGISGLAFGVIAAPEAGWSNPVTIAGLAVGVAALIAFVVVEHRSTHPLVPLRVFRRRPVVTANLVVLLLGGTLTSMFFFLPQYQEQVLGMTPLETGMSQLPIAVMIIVGSVAAPILAKLAGLSRALPAALALLLAGLIWLVLNPDSSGFSVNLLGAFLLIGAGLGLGLVNATALAVRDAAGDDKGLLSGLVNAAQQLGAAVGLAVLAGVATTTSGISFSTAFAGEAAFVLIALVLTLLPTAGTRTAPATPPQA